MVEIIKAYSMWEAFQYLQEQEQDNSFPYDKYIEIPMSNIPDESFENLGLLFCKQVGWNGNNENKNHVSVINHSTEGTKKWVTSYLIIFDNPLGHTLATNEPFTIKKDAIDKAKEISREKCRDTFVIIGKKPDGFNRLEAHVKYKPSLKQMEGEFKFIW